MKQFCFDTATTEELAFLAKHGDSESMRHLWESCLPTIDRIAGYFHARYPWIDQEDISQAIALEVPKIIRRFNPNKATQGAKRYFYFGFYRAAQDCLRREDPLGVKIPHKRRYPSFSHLCGAMGVRHGEATNFDETVIRGLENLDKGYVLDMEPGK